MRLLIYGSRSFALTVADLARDSGHEVAGMVDDYDHADGVVGRFDDLASAFDDCGFVLGIGYNDLPARWQAWQRVVAAGRRTPALIHPRAYVARTAHVGAGALVMACAVVDRAARLGDAAVVWPGACINHDAHIGANTFISPNATICGGAIVGASSFIGAAAVVVDGASLPDGSFVKMGSAYSRRALVHSQEARHRPEVK